MLVMFYILFGAVVPRVCSVSKNFYYGVHQRFVSFIVSCVLQYKHLLKETKFWPLDLTLH